MVAKDLPEKTVIIKSVELDDELRDFTSLLDLIIPEFQARKIEFVEIRGDTKDRSTPVKSFQNGDVPLFLLRLKAGGTGLDLTAADTVIHYDPWWNPAVENQATDRAHRIGRLTSNHSLRRYPLGKSGSE